MEAITNKNAEPQVALLGDIWDDFTNAWSNGVETVKDFLDVGQHISNAVDKVLDPAEDLIDHTQDALKETLEDLQGTVDGILQTVSETYQDNLMVTLDSLGSTGNNLMIGLVDSFGEIMNILQNNLEGASEVVEGMVQNITLDIKQTGAALEKNLRNVLIVAGETGSFLVDKTIYNFITLASWIILGIGLLVIFVSLSKRGIPEGAAGIIMMIIGLFFIGGFAALAFVPKFRTNIMKYTGLGLKQRLETAELEARIFQLMPNVLVIGETLEVNAYGSGFIREGEGPNKAFIRNEQVPITAFSDTQVSVRTQNLNLPSGSVNLVLQYRDGFEIRQVIGVERPVPPKYADLYVEYIRLNPSRPEAKRTVIATIKIKNRGLGDAGATIAKWKPLDTHPGIDFNVPSLKAGRSTEIQQEYTYTKAGNFTSTVKVDSRSREEESNEGNNIRTINVRVDAYEPTLVHNKTYTVRNNFNDLNTDFQLQSGDKVLITCNSAISIPIPPLNSSITIRATGLSAAIAAFRSGEKGYALLYKIGTRAHRLAAKRIEFTTTHSGSLKLRINSTAATRYMITLVGGVKTPVQLPSFDFRANIKVYR